MAKIVRRNLVDVIVEPVGKQQISMTTPLPEACFVDRFREIVVRDIRIQTRFNVTKILCREGMRIVLRMAGNERDAFVFTGEQVGIAVFRFGRFPCRYNRGSAVPENRRSENAGPKVSSKPRVSSACG